MNYPAWDIPASGLLIAVIAILHVFVSHFAVGGGFYLVLVERRARRDGDAPLLDYAKRLSRFFILLTLVFGAISGVGIWFTIGLVHPQATSSLINTFVWGWAIEWTFFFVEIAAAMVYYYGWDRLSARMHMAIGWIYVAAAWLSLVVINGILTYMLTPGQWILTRGFWDGFFNETILAGALRAHVRGCGSGGPVRHLDRRVASRRRAQGPHCARRRVAMGAADGRRHSALARVVSERGGRGWRPGGRDLRRPGPRPLSACSRRSSARAWRPDIPPPNAPPGG